MSKIEGGRLCSSCEKVIKDFRKKSNEEIGLAHMLSDSSVCGIYSQKQLNHSNSTSLSFIKSFAVIGLSSLSLIQIARAQDKPQPTHQVDTTNFSRNNSTSHISTNIDASIQDTVTIYGRVTQSTKNGVAGIPYANVYIPEYNVGTTTDLYGYYEINITDSAQANPKTISATVQYIGYSKRTISGIVPTESRKIDFELNNKDQDMIAFGVRVQPLHKRTWLGFKRLFQRKK